MFRYATALALAACLTSGAHGGRPLEGTVIEVSKTDFVLQTKKGPKTIKFSEYQIKETPSPRGKSGDLRYRLKAADVFEGMELHVEYITPLPDREWVCECMNTLNAEIDFKRLATIDGKYTLQLTLIARDGTKFEKKYEIDAGTSFETVRDQIQKSLQPVPTPKERWAVFGWGKNYLAIDGYIKDNKFSPIEKVEVSSPDLKRGQLPLVRPFNKPWPK
jgi:hypothetical protein